MTVLAQTYIHLAVHPTEQQIAETTKYLQYLAALSAIDHFKQDVVLEFRIEEGSLKGWLTVVGGLYIGLTNYGSLREGIDYAVKDSRDFSEWIVQKFKDEVVIPEASLYRTERRLGMPGRIQRLYSQIEEVERDLERGDDAAVSNDLQRLQDQIESIKVDLKDSGEDAIIVKIESAIPTDIRSKLPSPPPRTPALAHQRVASAKSEEEYQRRAKPRELLLQLEKPPNPPVFR